MLIIYFIQYSRQLWNLEIVQTSLSLKINKGTRFDFCRKSVKDVVKEIKKLSPRKATQSAEIPVKIVKENADILEAISDFFNGCVERGEFPSILKLANITPVFKKGFNTFMVEAIII